MLSLSMIVRDEAERLERCLASVAGFVDEMVVVDTGSSDATAAVAARSGAQVHQLAWPGDFAPARNHALQLVRGDWVLVLDADERLRPEAREPLRQLMARPEVLLITLLREERGSALGPYSNVSRLFRRHPAIRWSRAYHSMVDDSVAALLAAEPGWHLAHCAEPALIHEGYRPEVLESGGKARRLRQAMEEELRHRPGDPYTCAKLAGLEVEAGNRERAIALVEQGLAHCTNDAHAERLELLVPLALARAGEDPAGAEALYEEALALPLDPRLSLTPRLNLAALRLGRGALEEAAELCRQATDIAPEVALAWYNLGLIERRRGDLAAAIGAYRQALALEPDRPEVHQNLAAALLLGGDIPGAREGFRRAITLLENGGRAGEAENLRHRAGALVRLDP